MKYEKIICGKFIDRPNRFIAHVMVEEKVETVHVKNTGRCKELLIPGVRVVLEVCNNPDRKTKFDLICVYKEGVGLINMDSQAPNKVVYEWLRLNEDITFLKPEYKYGNSRLDAYFEKGSEKCLMEVKGVTLERNGTCYFPDAPTERGVKHMEELIGALKEGYSCYLAFVIQMEGVDTVYPNGETHKLFEETYYKALEAGVRVLMLGCSVTEDELKINRCKEFKTT